MATGAIDANGVWQYDDDDLLSPYPAYMNKAPASISALFAAQNAAWSTYSPTLTGITLGSGTVIARYKQIGRRVEFYLKVELGAGSAITGAVTATLPVAALQTKLAFGSGYARPTSGGSVYPITAWSSASATILALYTSASPIVVWSATAPATWNTTGYFILSGHYESA